MYHLLSYQNNYVLPVGYVYELYAVLKMHCDYFLKQLTATGLCSVESLSVCCEMGTQFSCYLDVIIA